MRKFKVSFEVETDEKGFHPYRGTEGTPARLMAHLPGGMYYAAIVSAAAKIEEIKPPLRDGYYYQGSYLYRRSGCRWDFRGIDGKWSATTRTDDELRDSFYVGPLRDECDD